MAGQQQHDLTNQVVQRFKERAQTYAEGIANRLGTPAAGVKLDNDQIARLWSFSPHQDPEDQYAQLTTSGMPPGQALDQVWPYRQKLYQAPTVGEQVKKAEQIRSMVEGNQSANP